ALGETHDDNETHRPRLDSGGRLWPITPQVHRESAGTRRAALSSLLSRCVASKGSLLRRGFRSSGIAGNAIYAARRPRLRPPSERNTVAFARTPRKRSRVARDGHRS